MMVKPLARGLDGLLRGYQLSLAVLLGGRCRYYPSCSAYAREAVRRHGAGRGLLLAGWRVCRCGPQPRWLGGGHGFDPVPEVWHDAFTRFMCSDFPPQEGAVMPPVEISGTQQTTPEDPKPHA